MRSLTCKSHSIASKRAVIGRSRDFDSLLAAYLASNPAKAQSKASPSSLHIALLPHGGRLILPIDISEAKLDKLTKAKEPTVSLADLTLLLLKDSHQSQHVFNPTRGLNYRDWIDTNTRLWMTESLRLFLSARKNQSDPSTRPK